MYMRLSGVLEDRHWLGMRDCRQSHWRKYCCNMDKRRGKEHWGLLKGQFNEEIHFQDLKQVLLTSVGLIRCLKLFAPLTVDSVPLVYMLSVEKEEKKKTNVKWIPQKLWTTTTTTKNQTRDLREVKKEETFFFFTLSLASLFSLQSLALSSQLFFVYLDDFSLQCTMAKVSGGQGAKLHIL